MDSNHVLEFCEKNKVTILNRSEFPLLLSEIHGPPERLYIQGEVRTLFEPCLGMVGTRKPSSYGMRSAMNFSKELSLQGFCIVSGLARGIDSACHRGTLMGGKKTIAVLAHGHDQIYPRENKYLAGQIIEAGGAVISEYPPFTGCMKHYFIARNRIVAGLSKGVIVIEASTKSGSLITANFANDCGRDVFVVPGPYDDTNYLGSHDLIQNGAKLLTSISDVILEYPEFILKDKTVKESETDAFFKEILPKEFSLEDLFLLSIEKGFQPSIQLKKWLDNNTVTEVSPQNYIWLN